MKIAHVLPALTKGGGEKVAAELANHAARTGHKITMIVGWAVDSKLLRDTLLPDVNVIFVSKPMGPRIGHYIRLIIWFWMNRELVDRQDIIHCHLSYGSMFACLVSIRRLVTRKKTPQIVQTNHSVGAPMSYLRRWLQAFCARQSDALALIAEDEYWSLFAKKYPKIRTEVIVNGISHQANTSISASDKHQYRRQFGIPTNCKLVVGAIGRMTVDRQPWMYLPVFGEIAREFGTDVHFLIAGGGGELDRMRALSVDQRLVEQVHFPGEVNEPMKALSAMDLYISINVGPITGLAGMEAASFGLPVIAMQFTSGYCAAPADWIWSSTNQLEVAKRACELLRSPSNLNSLAVKQQSYVQSHYTIEAMAKSYYDLYKATFDGYQINN